MSFMFPSAMHQHANQARAPSTLARGCCMASVLILAMTSTLSPAADFKGYAQPFVYVEARPQVENAEFVDEQGRPQRLADYRGQVVLINLWASWCAACVYEMPELDALQQQLRARGLKVLTLNQDLSDGKAVRQFLDSRGFHHLTSHLDLNYRFGQAYGQKLLPMTLLFDAQGRQIGHLVGPADWNSAAARALLEPYLPSP